MTSTVYIVSAVSVLFSPGMFAGFLVFAGKIVFHGGDLVEGEKEPSGIVCGYPQADVAF